MTKIFRTLCSICWGIIGLICLYAGWMMWRFSTTELGSPLGADVERFVGVVFFLFAVLFLLYAFRQAKRDSQMALIHVFRKSVPGTILTILTYGVFILLVCFFTMGEISLRPEYARPILIVGAVLLLLDLCVNLGLFPDRWEESCVVRWILRKAGRGSGKK